MLGPCTVGSDHVGCLTGKRVKEESPLVRSLYSQQSLCGLLDGQEDLTRLFTASVDLCMYVRGC